MSPLDEILYLADGLEPGRDFPERAGFLATAFGDLARAMHDVLANGRAYLQSRGLTAAPETIAAIEHYATVPSREKHPA
jgi:HD superfamily phosphohydrolase YqeK